jgi:hypothetical protein
VLFPPTQASNLYPHGKIDTIHRNGLISYEHNVMRSDGLGVLEAARFRVRALEEKIAATKGKREKKKMEALLEEAIDAEMDLLVEEGGDDDFAGMELDDEDGDGDEGFPEDDDSDDDQEGTESLVSSRSKGKSKANVTDEHNEDGEPSSFSRIPTSLLHRHFSLPTTAFSVDSDFSTKFDLSKTSAPFVVDINPGEMLYLPASWWHEVTSSSPDNKKSNVHMAFNYWFYPPDGLEKFDEPYQDAILWEYLRSTVGGGDNGGDEAQEVPVSKRKRDADGGSRKAKKAKH